jgi:arylsulfatase A-like enzyme
MKSRAGGLEENTMIVFASDNGDPSTGRGKRGPTSNLPLRAGKAWIYEGGIRVLLIIKGPGVMERGRDCGIPVISTDFHPTRLEMADRPLRPDQHEDGVRLAPLPNIKASKLLMDL